MFNIVSLSMAYKLGQCTLSSSSLSCVYSETFNIDMNTHSATGCIYTRQAPGSIIQVHVWTWFRYHLLNRIDVSCRGREFLSKKWEVYSNRERVCCRDCSNIVVVPLSATFVVIIPIVKTKNKWANINFSNSFNSFHIQTYEKEMLRSCWALYESIQC